MIASCADGTCARGLNGTNNLSYNCLTKSLQRAKPLSLFLQKQPGQQDAARQLALEKNADIAQWWYLPVVGRQDWVAVLNAQGQIEGFLPGDGF
ncbi:MAG: hypothetical protein ABIQ90_08820 [Polaromonas sp.]